MIKIILRMAGRNDEVVFLPQIPERGHYFARSTDLCNESLYRVERVIWIVPREGLVPSELECAIVEISW
jgi:hypothetical protein